MTISSFLEKLRITLPWIPSYAWQCYTRRIPELRPVHLIIGVADHFEPWDRHGPRGTPDDRHQQDQRLKTWCQEYSAGVKNWRDDDGRHFRHTYFYPAEQYDADLIDRLAEHCRDGWGEIEVHLHHGINGPDTKQHTLQTLTEFRDALASRGCLSLENGAGLPRYAFVHGNWALANSAQGRFCGVDDEMQILADTGCYADFTLPAPSSAQINKINSIYECALPLHERAPHRRGVDLQCGRVPRTFPLIVQGPLMIDFHGRNHGWLFPRIEYGEMSANNPPTLRRLGLWRQAGIAVQGRPEWLFIKLHCHGMAPQDREAMVGRPLQNFLSDLIDDPTKRADYRVHFVTMREMANIIIAACSGHSGDPGEYRDYRFQLIDSSSNVCRPLTVSREFTQARPSTHSSADVAKSTLGPTHSPKS